MSSVYYQLTRLENGVTIATARMPHVESACVGMWTRVGSRHESPRLNGIAHFTEHLLFKGTPTRGAYQISREIEGMGASVDAFTTEDHTCYYSRGPAQSLKGQTDVLLDLFCNPTFDPVEIEREREVILEEIAMYRDNPSQHVEDLLGMAAWPEHPLGRPITGTEPTVSGLRRGDLFTFHQRCYAGRNVLVTAAGKVDHKAFVDQVAAKMGTREAAERIEFHRVPTYMRERGPRRCVETRDVEQSHLCVGFHSVGRNDPERYALRLLNVLLGENMSSRLFQVLREDRGLCYSVYSDALTLDDTGLMSVYAGLDLANVPYALDLISATLREFVTEPVSEDDLEQAVNYTVGQSQVAFETTLQQMMWIGECLVAHDRIIEPEETFDRLRRVNPADIQSIAERVFHPAGTAIAYIGAEVPELALDAFLS